MTMYSEMGNAELARLHTDYTKSNGWQTKNHSKVEVAAYYKAQARGFKPGSELKDWLEAKAEIARKFVPPHEFFV
ncbi:Protein of unknown function [Thiothrix caldifontis]|uniref:DUF2934 domain-containing protein n=1 Tax=Thiothrix caldifontis TaxID=525918 RepID=A0A1H4GUR2_9GAMM|nr:DUF2934 domain-containing protein [Thiothrix caldifontis]SEB13293.1 Protein of unknown function [Thiothrix caldifontis]